MDISQLLIDEATLEHTLQVSPSRSPLDVSAPSCGPDGRKPRKKSPKPRITTRIRPSRRNSRSQWSISEDIKVVVLRGEGMKWDDIEKRLPGRSATSCRLHYQNYLERPGRWTEDRQIHLVMLYEKYRAEMWTKIAQRMDVPWRTAEAMYSKIRECEAARQTRMLSTPPASQQRASYTFVNTGHG